MSKAYHRPTLQSVSPAVHLLTTVVIASTASGGTVDPIHPRDPGESLAPSRDEWEAIDDSSNRDSYGNLW